jgi:hypothetical protein
MPLDLREARRACGTGRTIACQSSTWRSTVRTALGAGVLLLVGAHLGAQLTPEALEECMKPTPAARHRLPRDIGAWRRGDPIPAEALRYVAFCGCMPLETDSIVVMREATNYPFLVALATDSRANPVVVDMAVARALTLAGPTRVFADLSARYRSDPHLGELRVHRSIQARMRRRNVWVRGMAIETLDFRSAGYGEVQAGVAAMEIAQRLRHGADWKAIQDEYARRYHYQNGCPLVQDLGSFVTSEGRDEKNAGRELMVPSYHLPRLLRRRAGDVAIMTVRPTAFDYSTGHLLLWQVLEVYEPGRHDVQGATSHRIAAAVGRTRSETCQAASTTVRARVD